MVAKKKSVRRRTRKSTRKREVRPRFWFPLLLRLLLGFSVCLIGFLLVIDNQIKQRFQSGVHLEAAQIFARPPVLSSGNEVSPADVAALLVKQGYKKTKRVDGPNQFVAIDNRMDVFLGETPWAGEQPKLVRLQFERDKLVNILDHASGNIVSEVRLSSDRVGTLQLGPYEDRLTLKLHQMPESLIKALLAMEDRDFEQHIGVNPSAIFRALVNNIIHRKAIQGGSTITQQLIKNLFLSPERSLSRKVMEALMAIVMEFRFSKAEILQHYLNEIFLGQSGNRAVHGFALASEFYFDKPLNELKLDQIATLVGIVPAPSFFNPRRHPERSLQRRDIVIDTLTSLNIISRQSADVFKQRPLGIAKERPSDASEFPTYIDYLHRQIRQYFSADILRSGGLKLYTTLEPNIQRGAQTALSRTLAALESKHGMKAQSLQGAAIVIDPKSGDILALVGDRQKGYSGFNRAIDAQRPIGSLVKPFVFLTALSQPERYSLATVAEDQPLDVPLDEGKVWSPKNYDKTYRGKVTMLEALTKSYNVPTVNIGLDVGVTKVIETIRQLGVNKNLAAFPSLLLGANHHSPLEVAQLYQPIANLGTQFALRSLTQVNNQQNETIARFPKKAKNVIQPDIAYILDFALKQVVARGTAAKLYQSFPRHLNLAGKTGTTDNYRDSWFSGYSGNLLTVVWVGKDDNKPIGLTGSGGAMVVWKEIMSEIALSTNETVQPTSVTYQEIDQNSGLLANQRCTNRVSLPISASGRIKRFAPCAGVIGKIQSWFNINVNDKSSSGDSSNPENKFKPRRKKPSIEEGK